MSASDRYFTMPLALLHSGTSACDVLNAGIHIGQVNAGIGYKEVHKEERFQELLDDAREAAEKQKEPITAPEMNVIAREGSPFNEEECADLWDCALAGWKILGIRGGSREEAVRTWLKLYYPGGVFFRMSLEFVWNAFISAQKAEGRKVDQRDPLSFREFRILAAILSAPLNKRGFCFLGWETIQARACGFHTKALFAAEKDTLPAHCQPLTRSQIRVTCDNLEALGFFARVRYSTGGRGGFSAYSFRHERTGLIEAVKGWSLANKSLRAKTAAHRAADLLAFVKTP